MKRKALVALVVGIAFAVAPAAAAAITPITSDVSPGGGSSASIARPAGISQAEYRALMIRGEALNQRYGNAVTQLSPQQFRALYQAASGLSPQELVALVARGAALEHQYGSSSSVTLQPDVLGGNGGASTSAVPTGDGDSFAWGPVAIGAATLAGVMLLALTSLAVTRRRHHLSF